MRGGPTTGITVELGEHHPTDADLRLELGRDGDGILSRHRIGDEERLIGAQHIAHPHDLIHELFVEVHASAGVDDEGVELVLLRLGESGLGHLGGVLLPLHDEDRHADRLTEDLQLQDRGGPDQVGGDEEDATPLLLEPEGELGGRGGLSTALQAHHQDGGGHIGATEVELLALLIPEQADHPVMDDLDELLGGIDGLEDLLAEGLLHRRIDETAHDPKIHVGVQERHLDLFDGILDILLCYLGLSTQGSEDGGELIAY